MNEFYIKTVDNEYSYDSQVAVGTVFDTKNDFSLAKTQGAFQKAQKGKNTLVAIVTMKIPEADFSGQLIPMSEYNDECLVTFDRDIPGRGSKTGTFVIADMKIKDEYQEGGSWEYLVELTLAEVVYI